MSVLTPTSPPAAPSDPDPAAGPARLEIDTVVEYRVDAPTSFVFTLLPALTPRQRIVDEQVTVTPELPHRIAELDAGERRLIRVGTDGGPLRVSYRATVEVEPRTARPVHLDERDPGEVPDDVLPFLAPSRYCESDLLGRFADATFGRLAPGYARVQAVSDWVGEMLAYEPGASDGSTTATDTLVSRAGVCRDFAHLSIALCRALDVPARYVAGYGIGVDPPDFHGFFEAYVGRNWYLFDPTGMAPNDGLVRIVAGRDAAEAAFAELHGDAELVDKQVSIHRAAGDRTTPASADAPASTA